MIILLVLLLGSACACCVFYSLWRKERRSRVALQAALQQEYWWRVTAQWRYARLKEAIETESSQVPKVLTALHLRIRWIENPPPLIPPAQQKRVK